MLKNKVSATFKKERLKEKGMASTPTQEFSYELRIPKERVAVLIGSKGKTKKALERETKTHINVHSDEGIIRIEGKDALLLYLAREIIRAIGRGFNPEIATQLIKSDYGFEIIPLQDYARNQHDFTRLRGRVIGEGGRSRRVIEDLTETTVCVYGKTASIIGPAEHIADARRAIQSLLAGSPHAHVYRWLERRKRTKRIQE